MESTGWLRCAPSFRSIRPHFSANGYKDGRYGEPPGNHALRTNCWCYFRICILAFRCESNGLTQTEFEDRFRGNDHLLALGEHLGARTADGAGSSSDGCALSVSNDRTNDCSYYGSTPDQLSRALVHANSTVAFLLQVRSGDVIPPSVDGNRLNVQRNLGATCNITSSFEAP
jgi:hypothetical protein